MNGYVKRRLAAAPALENARIVFLAGAKGCGKTTYARQLANEIRDAKYYNLEEERISRLLNEIRTDNNRVYIIDNATEDAARAIAEAVNSTKNCHTVITGGQPLALKALSKTTNNSTLINIGFISYPEWLAYEGEKTSYVDDMRTIYKGLGGTRQYLQGCLLDAKEELLSEWELTVALLELLHIDKPVSLGKVAFKYCLRFFWENNLIKVTDDIGDPVDYDPCEDADKYCITTDCPLFLWNTPVYFQKPDDEEHEERLLKEAVWYAKAKSKHDGHSTCEYDRERGEAYLLYPDGHREYLNEKKGNKKRKSL